RAVPSRSARIAVRRRTLDLNPKPPPLVAEDRPRTPVEAETSRALQPRPPIAVVPRPPRGSGADTQVAPGWWWTLPPADPRRLGLAPIDRWTRSRDEPSRYLQAAGGVRLTLRG